MQEQCQQFRAPFRDETYDFGKTFFERAAPPPGIPDEMADA